ncbi:TauD/TfdA family dioxygenase [Nocardia sp. CDC153]|uniref:TauD/TfdA family dioxygenase n=1 Tax=Nocardia sp. CDC153 TaxID=3112167 RepID=UPI002DBC4948|nr:TauD/TfdA family dioxygenase [Nocardia sp. CDC153]MEC3951914.1 TauD/TfdA family dioxygenase [Nocardia sp. CDC153]
MKSVLSERQTLHPSDIERRDLPESATRAIRHLAAEIAVTVGPNPETATTLAHPVLLRHIDAKYGRLPDAVHEAMRPPATDSGVTVIRPLSIGDEELGLTPHDWRQAAAQAGDRGHRSASFELDIAMLLLARCAGEPFGWEGQQGGRLVNNIVPTPGHEHEQSGASSTTLLSPHTEDAFHPDRANLLMLGCLRNPDRVGTTVASVRRTELSAAQRETLGRARLPILPDVSYGTGFADGHAPAVATLGTDDGGLTLRFDPAYTPLDTADLEFQSAYRHLAAELERVCITAALAPGEVLLVDNDVVVHGRVPFTPRYDGTDRWLKRVNIRLPQRRREIAGRGDAAAAAEDGYGQRVVAPFRTSRGSNT